MTWRDHKSELLLAANNAKEYSRKLWWAISWGDREKMAMLAFALRDIVNYIENVLDADTDPDEMQRLRDIVHPKK
jgi:hypothetical protein